MYWNKIWYNHSWFQEDESEILLWSSDFSSRHTMRFTCVVFTGQHVDRLQSNQASFKINLVIPYLSSCFMVCKILQCTCVFLGLIFSQKSPELISNCTPRISSRFPLIGWGRNAAHRCLAVSFVFSLQFVINCLLPVKRIFLPPVSKFHLNNGNLFSPIRRTGIPFSVVILG